MISFLALLDCKGENPLGDIQVVVTCPKGQEIEGSPSGTLAWAKSGKPTT